MTKCTRCGKEFTQKTPDQIYGPVCARKLAGQVQIDSQALVSGKVLRKKKAPQKEQVCHICGCSDLMACPGGCAWVEPDLCSSCATPEQIREAIETIAKARR